MELRQTETPEPQTPDTMSAIVQDNRFPDISKALGLFLEHNLSPDKALANGITDYLKGH